MFAEEHQIALLYIVLPYRFFKDYKKNEHKEVKVDEFLGADLARKTISEAMVSGCCNFDCLGQLCICMDPGHSVVASLQAVCAVL